MRIFFSMQHLGSFLVYEPVIRELAARGHQLHLAISRTESLGWEKALERVVADHPQVTWGWLSPSPETVPFWFDLAKTIRLWADYLRYFEPHYDATPRLRARAEERVPPGLVRLSHLPLFHAPRNRQRLLRALRAIERALPTVESIRRELQAYSPDLVIITPLVFLGSWQFEVLRAARAEGLRTVVGVGSWDHLSSKALIRDVPQRMFVWNETQKDEAVRLHGVPADRVVVTGAQCFDRWFGRIPARTREQFCRHVGLPADRPLILYCCSALFWGSPVEAAFVSRWVRSLRESPDPELREAAVLVRPHPARTEEWRTSDLSAYEHVALYGSNPVDADSQEDYFESLFHSSAVVGLNTSAFLEAAIVGRPVLTILTPEFAENQEGTLHFRYLLTVGGGVLQASRSFEEHHRHLGALLREPERRASVTRQFVHDFIRPHGLDVPATPVFCDAVADALGLRAPAPVRTPIVLIPVRWMAYPAFVLLRRIYGTELFRDDWRRTDREYQLRLEMRERERQERRRSAEETKRERERRRAAKAETRESAIRAAEAVRRRQDAEKARRLQAKAREKAARVRRDERAAKRARIKRRVKGLFTRSRAGGEEQAT
jgi:hypothetical protein